MSRQATQAGGRAGARRSGTDCAGSPRRSPLTVALVGNPNTGKTTLFNRLTGARERVGNWSGVTVDTAEEQVVWAGIPVRFVDLPGIFSLSAHTPDERVTRDFLESGRADLVVNVLDASNLERSLCLTRQLLDLHLPVVGALNLADVARRRGLRIDVRVLSESLGSPVCPVVASRGRGVDALRDRICGMLGGLKTRSADTDVSAGRMPPACGDPEAEEAESEKRLSFARGLAHAVIRRDSPPGERRSDRVDRVLLSSWAGIPLFLAVMYGVFWLTVRVTHPMVDFLDSFAGAFLVHGLRFWLTGLGAPDLLVAVLTDGVGTGLVAVATFVPPIFMIFLCLGLLEGSGYMPRAAFVMDRLLRRIGLPGKAFIPLVVGFGCTVPALLATRTLEVRRDRVLTMLIAPFMSCGARLPVYTVFALAFFPRSGNQVVFALYLAGIVLAILSGLLLHRTLLPGAGAAYVLELPPYHLPPVRMCLAHAWHNLRSFLVRAGQVIVGVAVAFSLLNAVWTSAGPGQSAGRSAGPAEGLGRVATPVLAPLGIAATNWPATVGLMTGVLAKEAIIGTLDVLYAQIDAAAVRVDDRPAFDLRAQVAGSIRELKEGYGWVDRRGSKPPHSAWPGMIDALRRSFGSGAAAFAYLLFVLAYSPCVAALAVLTREAGWRWTLFSIVYQSLLAWMTATLFYQAATFSAHPRSSLEWMAAVVLLAALIVFSLRAYGRRRPMGILA